MGTDVGEVAEIIINPGSLKVHHLMCSEFLKLVNRISSIFPEIEAARPRCSSGIQALCFLSRAIDKSKSILQYCSESSKLYLALTGDVILSRCQRSRNLLEQSLCQIQNNVPMTLAVELSQIVDDLRGAAFMLDPYEEEAGKVVRELLHKGDSTSDSIESSEIKALQIAASRLHMTSPKAIVVDKRSLKKLLDKVGDTDPNKKKILTYLLYLLKKYGNLIIEEHRERASACHHRSFAFQNLGNGSMNNQSSEVEPQKR